MRICRSCRTALLDTPAEQVWDIVRDFNALDEFVETVASCTTEGSGVGAVRTLILQDGGKVQEKLESLDNEGRSLTYSIVRAPMPVQNYIGTMQVRERARYIADDPDSRRDATHGKTPVFRSE